MTVYLITYDLKSPGQDYSKLYEKIKSLGDTNHPLESVWFVDTPKRADEIKAIVRSAMDTNDNVFITRVTSGYSGYANKSLWTWLTSKGL